MSQSRFSIVLVGVSALFRRPLVSRLRPADGERSPWVVFTARRCLPFRRLPLGGLVLPLGELAFGFTASAFRHAPLRSCPRRVGLRAHGFRFSARTASGLPLGELVLPPSASELPSSGWFFRSAGWPSGLPFPLFGTHRFGVALGELVLPPSASAFATRRVGSAAFCFGDCRLAGWPSGLPFPLFGTHRFGVATRRVGSSVFRFGDCRSAGWPSGSRLSLFGTHRSAPPHRRSEGRRNTPTRHLFHFKTLISTC